MDAEGKKVLVVGTGLSGIAAAGLLLEKGLDVILYDGKIVRSRHPCQV